MGLAKSGTEHLRSDSDILSKLPDINTPSVLVHESSRTVSPKSATGCHIQALLDSLSSGQTGNA